MNKVAVKSICILCKEKLKDVNNIVFFQCTWKGEGMVKGEEKERVFSGQADMLRDYITFKEGNKLVWQYLEITTEPLNLNNI